MIAQLHTQYLSQENAANYKTIRNTYNQLKEIDTKVKNITESKLTQTFLQNIKSEISTAIRNDYHRAGAIKHEIKKEYNEYLRIHAINDVRDTDVRGNIYRENENKEQEDTFENLYNHLFLKKLLDYISSDSEYYPIITKGVRQQYKSIKGTVLNLGKEGDIYEKDGFGNNSFRYINLFSIETRGDDINMPLEETKKDMLVNVLKIESEKSITFAIKSLLTYETQNMPLKEHYEKVKKSFYNNIVYPILDSDQADEMYEIYIRTDLFRYKIKSDFNLDKGFTQLIILAKVFNDVQTLEVVKHLIEGAIAHKHRDNSNSGSFMNHAKAWLKIIDLGDKVNDLDKQSYNAKILGTLVK